MKLLSAAILTFLLPGALLADPALVTHRWAGLPFPTASPIAGDPLFFQEQPDGTTKATLLLEPSAPPILQSSTLEVTYEAGKDFTWQPGSREIVLPAGSRIPFTPAAALYPAPNSPNSYNGTRDGKSWMLYGAGRFFHDRQCLATYPTTAPWTGPLPVAAPDAQLALLRQRLRSRFPLKMVTLGDSISTGADASAVAGAPPLQPGYPDLVAQGLEHEFGVAVEHKNLSVGGMDAVWGLTQISAVMAQTPDLVLLAFGMNDASGHRSPDDFLAVMQELTQRIQTARPGCTVILVSPMTANPEWKHAVPELYPAYAAKLASLAGPDRALANVTEIWTAIVERKSYLSLSGNGLNHPNDFGHRLYAATVLAVIGGR
jgi:acyl-CoA thioesterase I